jgi:hypothetical protein
MFMLALPSTTDFWQAIKLRKRDYVLEAARFTDGKVSLHHWSTLQILP